MYKKEIQKGSRRTNSPSLENRAFCPHNDVVTASTIWSLQDLADHSDLDLLDCSITKV